MGTGSGREKKLFIIATEKRRFCFSQNVTNFGVLTAQNGYKSGTFAGGESMVGSPARRSEVSPIQSHTTSRRGWHSPNQDSIPISPKSDHYPMQHRLPNGHTNGGGAQYWTNTYGPVNGGSDHPSSHQQQQAQHHSVLSSPRSISRNGSSYALESAAKVYYSKSVDSFAASDATMPYAMPEFEYRTAESNGPSSLLSAGTVASVSSGHNGHHHITPRANYSPATTSSSNELLEELHQLDGGTRIKRLHPAAARINSFTVNHHQHNASNNNNNNHVANYGPTQRGSQSAMDGGGESKYGKLLQQPPIGASSAPPYGGSIYYDHPQHNGINNNLVHQSTHQAHANGAGTTPAGHSKTTSASGAAPPHVPRRNATTKLDANSSRIVNGNNNNNYFEVPTGTTGRGSQHHQQQQPGSSFTATFASKFHKLTGSRSTAHESAVNGGSGSGKLNHVNNNNNGSMASGNGGDSASNAPPYQQHQINNATTHLHPLQALTALSGKLPHPAPPLSSSSSPPPPVQGAPTHLHHTSAHGGGGHHHHHPHGHPMGHALSSPESAYSTGYSTDGTSPGGCSYTPEYYINIRTGTHYFPKAAPAHHGRGVPGSGCIERTGPAAVGASGGHENGAKFKCALNRIEEKHVEFCIEQEKHASPRRGSASNVPPPVAANQSNTKPTVSGPATNGACVLSQPQQQQPKQQTTVSTTGPQPQTTAQPSLAQPTPAQSPPNAVAMSPIMQKNLGMQHYRSIESPSPRQRCRIRTNPWLTTADGALASNCLKRTEQDSGSTSSGIKSSSGTDDNKNDHKQTIANSDTDSSSSTEKVVSNKRILTPRSLKKIGDISRLDSKAAAVSVTFGSNQESDEDATLNEMMGKFDESYHYEKETDILSCSDSDPTDCPTDIDTGQDAGDECDTDDLLDLDFIDTGSVQEVTDKETYRHTASCSIHSFPEGKAAPYKQRMSRNRRTNESGSGSKRRKKLVRTRKKPSENAALDTGTNDSRDSSGLVSRGCRSLGGTPMSLRRNQPDAECRTPARSSPLTNRSNSLTFTEVHSLHSRILAISESEKALLKADLEADVKYKQLIHEAESILFSMKSNSSICLKELVTAPPPVPPRDPQPQPAIPPKEVPPTAISSPRRVCNPPANKRVEMLRNCEADLRRELAKTCSQKCADPAELNPAEGVIVNKRLEVLRYETSPFSLSAPNSPKNTRILLQRKTPPVAANFVQSQQMAIQSGLCTPETLATDLKYCANLSSPPPPPPRLVSKSPTIIRRRFRSQSPHLNIESDSDSDDVSRNLDYKAKDGKGRNGNKENHLHQQPAPPLNPGSVVVNGSACKGVTGKQMNNFRHTIHGPGSTVANGDETTETELMIIGGEARPVKGMHKSPLISFRSVDIGSPVTDDSYCPQSEPLKRKIYTCSAAFERIQRTLDQDPDCSKNELLERISLLRRERQNKSPRPSCINPGASPQLIDIVADIKNCLIDQKIELKLTELKESDN
ncbi:uncharacterized protein LOC128278953 [Anopheles cruzii]|uniref:uncharacterized protein LOC128278953 n=1 Tax=Anopheles cruzii TaxID=68878 RepID=UPI0022EC6711|nr:uncharacterized protein LOC128278953 [Anopheles cruzii]